MPPPKLIVKKNEEAHFAKNLGNGAVSYRRLLPGVDGCRVKVTDFLPDEGFSPGKAIVHATDELVYVLSGRIHVQSEGVEHYLDKHDFYFVPAGVPTTFKALKDSRCLCVSSQGAAKWPLPDDE